MILIIGCW